MGTYPNNCATLFINLVSNTFNIYVGYFSV